MCTVMRPSIRDFEDRLLNPPPGRPDPERFAIERLAAFLYVMIDEIYALRRRRQVGVTMS